MQIITCHLMGGIGNQLFQLFTTIAYGINKKRSFLFEYSERLENRETYWHSFLERLKIFTTANPKYNPMNLILKNLVIYRERGFHYKELPNTTESFKLYGYFQSYKYFENEYAQICSLIQLQEKQKETRDMYSFLFSEKSRFISMHFRLGDYKTKPECHNILPFQYYDKALEYMNLDENTRVLYFCEKEDNHYVSEIIEKLKEKNPGVEFLKVNDNIEDWRQLLLMSNCDDHIIANSSFSWWGAYFNGKKDKKVCYPCQWFGPQLSFHNTKDMYPESWQRILF